MSRILLGEHQCVGKENEMTGRLLSLSRQLRDRIDKRRSLSGIESG
jgi:hypothetical protein